MQKRSRFFSELTIFLFVAIVLFLLFGCATQQTPNYETWTHVIAAENYTEKGDYAVYKITDERFNTTDWFDVWMDDSIWDPSYGWSSFESVYDDTLEKFLYEPEYYEGYTEWYTYPNDPIVGATLRFYRLSERE